MPRYSRLCPICFSGDHFSIEERCHTTPMPYLDQMRGYIDELVSLPKMSFWQRCLGDPHREQVREIVESFDVVEILLRDAFAENMEVLTAAEIMREMLTEEVARRTKLI